MKRINVLLTMAILLQLGLPNQADAQGHIIKNISVPQISKEDALGVLVPYAPDRNNVSGKEESVDTRMPLILVHGIGAEEDKYYHWARFLEFADKNPEFQKRFKVYLFRYDSTRSVPQLSGRLQNALRAFIQQNVGDRKIRILAYSEGGLLTRNAMQDPEINAHTDKVITIATPFHGSPLANPTWLKQQLKDDSVLSPVRLTNKLSYWIARKRYPSFEADFHWDNFDSAISADEYKKCNGRGEVKGYVTAYSDKLITYGSYFGVDVDPKHQLPQALGVDETLPKEKPHFRNPFSRHFIFSLIRNNISAMPLAYHPFKKRGPKPTPIEADKSEQIVRQIPGAEPVLTERTIGNEPADIIASAQIASYDGVAFTAVDGMADDIKTANLSQLDKELLPLMVYNDGISPISSTLWLGRFTPEYKQVKNPAMRMLNALKNLKGKAGARLFTGLDHRDWMDGSTRINSPKIKDLLHPTEPAKTAFEWFIYDLMSDTKSVAVSAPKEQPAEHY